MQQKSFRLLIAAALIGLVVWGARVLFPSPQRVIRSRLLQLAKTASFEPKDGTFVRAYKAGQLSGFLTLDVVISADLRGYGEIQLTGRDQVEEAQKAILASGQLSGLKVEFKDISVTLGADKLSAVANLTSKVTFEGQSEFLVNEFNFSLKKVNGKWLINRVEAVKTFSQSSPDATGALSMTDQARPGSGSS
jgi:hypothetical protein